MDEEEKTLSERATLLLYIIYLVIYVLRKVCEKQTV